MRATVVALLVLSALALPLAVHAEPVTVVIGHDSTCVVAAFNPGPISYGNEQCTAEWCADGGSPCA